MLETLSVAFSMFSVLPVPRCAWSEKNMRFALCAFPLVGAVVGAAWWLWCAVCALVPVGDVLRGVGLCLLPVLLTGGIHLDGYEMCIRDRSQPVRCGARADGCAGCARHSLG